MISQFKTAVQIDKAVKVDDSMALRGLNILNRVIAEQVDSRYQQVNSSLSAVQNLIKIASRILMVIIISLICCLGFLLYLAIIKPIENLTNIMSKISTGKLEVNVPYVSLNNEIGQMSKACSHF